MRELKKAIIAACKGYLNEFYRTCWDLDLWEIVEAIELVTELAENSNAEPDIFESLGIE